MKRHWTAYKYTYSSSLTENLTEEIFDGDRHFVFRTPPEAAGEAAAGSSNIASKVPGDLALVGSYPKNYFSNHIPRGPQKNLGYYNPPPHIQRIQQLSGEAEGKHTKTHQDTHFKTVDLASYEHQKKQRLKEEASHDKRASNERALKERTVIEFFEREKLPPENYHGHHDSDDSHHGYLPHSHHHSNHDRQSESREKTPYYIEKGGKNDKASTPRLYYEPTSEESRQSSVRVQGLSKGPLAVSDYGRGNRNNSYASSIGNKTQELLKKGTHVDYVYHPKQGSYGPSSSSLRDYFPSLDETADSNGWRETGYKIVTEVEYVDKGKEGSTVFAFRNDYFIDSSLGRVVLSIFSCVIHSSLPSA